MHEHQGDSDAAAQSLSFSRLYSCNLHLQSAGAFLFFRNFGFLEKVVDIIVYLWYIVITEFRICISFKEVTLWNVTFPMKSTRYSSR